MLRYIRQQYKICALREYAKAPRYWKCYRGRATMSSLIIVDQLQIIAHSVLLSSSTVRTTEHNMSSACRCQQYKYWKICRVNATIIFLCIVAQQRLCIEAMSPVTIKCAEVLIESVRYFCSVLTTLIFSWQVLKRVFNMKFHETPSSL